MVIKIRSFLQQHKKFLSILLLSGVGVFLMPFIANATVAELFISAIGKLVELYVTMAGWIILQLTHILIKVASYNEFVNSGAVVNGWVIMRDVVNMFFIVILLVIAFATIFNVNEYKYQAMLPRLLIMAVVINFSRTICGIFIDIGQVVMLTFVNGFRAAAGGNFVNALRINELLKFDEKAVNVEGTEPNLGYIFVGFILAAIMATITVIVMAAIVMILVMRIVILWFLVVLSPLAFLASVWPSSRIKQKYATWWDMFLDNIMVGPLLAFFLWLSLLVLGSGDIGNQINTGSGIPTPPGEDVSAETRVGITSIGTEQNMISYIIGIGMLLGSLYMAQSMRSAGSGIAGAALGKIQGYARAGVRKVGVGGAKKLAGVAYEKSYARASKDALVARVQTSNIGKALGLGTQEYKDEQKARRDVRALRGFGMKTKSAVLTTKLERAEAEKISQKGLTNNQLLEKYNKESDKITKAAYAREIASNDLIRNPSDFKEYAGGDKRLEFALRSASLKAGNQKAFIGYQEDPTKPGNALKDLQDIYHRVMTTHGKRKQLFTTIKEGSRLNEKGEFTDELAPQLLSVIEKSDFDRWDDKTKQDIKDAFVLTEANDKNKFDSLKLEDKFNNLFSEKFSDTTGPGGNVISGYSTKTRNELVAEQQRLHAASTKGAQEAGVLKKTAIDIDAEQAFSHGAGKHLTGADKDFSLNISNRLNKAVAEVSNIKDDGTARAMLTELTNIKDELEKTAQKLDNSGRKTGQYNEKGEEMSNFDVVKRSKLYSGVEGAKNIVKEMIDSNTSDNKEKREAATSSIGISAKYMNEAHMRSKGLPLEKQYEKSIKNYKVMEARGRNKLNDAVKVSKGGARKKAMSEAFKELNNAMRVLDKNAGAFTAAADDVDRLKTELTRLKNLGAKVSQADVDKLNEEFDKIRAGKLA